MKNQSFKKRFYDQKAAQLELEEKVLIDPSLKEKTREEMGLEPFRGEEIRSSVLGIPVAISVDTIAGVIRRASGGKYIFGLKMQERHRRRLRGCWRKERESRKLSRLQGMRS